MSGIYYTYAELCDAIEAEAATLPPETWRGGEFNLYDYIVESMQVGIIEQIDPEDDIAEASTSHSPTPGLR